MCNEPVLSNTNILISNHPGDITHAFVKAFPCMEDLVACHVLNTAKVKLFRGLLYGFFASKFQFTSTNKIAKQVGKYESEVVLRIAFLVIKMVVRQKIHGAKVMEASALRCQIISLWYAICILGVNQINCSSNKNQ